MARALSFNGQNLQDSSFSTVDFAHESGQLSVDVLPVGAYGGRAIGSRIGTKELQINGYAKAADANALDVLIDTLKANIYGRTGNLDVDYAGTTRRYVAVCTGFEVKKERADINKCNISLKLVALGCGQATAVTTQNYTGKTADYTGSLAFTGSAAPRPVLTITVTSQTALSQVKFSNDTTVQFLTVSRTFANGDVLVIDCDAQTVKLNGTIIDYSGVIPAFVQGTNAFTVDITATAVSYSLGISYYPLYF